MMVPRRRLTNERARYLHSGFKIQEWSKTWKVDFIAENVAIHCGHRNMNTTHGIMDKKLEMINKE